MKGDRLRRAVNRHKRIAYLQRLADIHMPLVLFLKTRLKGTESDIPGRDRGHGHDFVIVIDKQIAIRRVYAHKSDFAQVEVV